MHCHSLVCLLQEIDELLGQNLTEEDEDAIAAELESILVVSSSSYMIVGEAGYIGGWC